MPPDRPRIYYIVHVDNLPSILEDGKLLCDAVMQGRASTGTSIGINAIKERRLSRLTLTSHPGLYVGQCVPFYFCPRSVMLYVIDRKRNPELAYMGGQRPIVHLEADLYETVAWAEGSGHRWAFTTSNAGASYFEDYSDLSQLHLINWGAVQATTWSGQGVEPTVKDGKQAELLVEHSVPWELINRVGVYSARIRDKVHLETQKTRHKPEVQIKRDWYY